MRLKNDLIHSIGFEINKYLRTKRFGFQGSNDIEIDRNSILKIKNKPFSKIPENVFPLNAEKIPIV